MTMPQKTPKVSAAMDPWAVRGVSSQFDSASHNVGQVSAEVSKTMDDLAETWQGQAATAFAGHVAAWASAVRQWTEKGGRIAAQMRYVAGRFEEASKKSARRWWEEDL